MTPRELAELCNQPGGEGALWRLIRAWDPDKLAEWARTERKATGLSPEQAVACAAEVIAGAMFALAQQLGGDKRGAILGERGLVSMVRLSVAHKMDQVGGVHSIIKPKVG